MANQTTSGTVNFDSPSILGLLNGETITMNGGELIIDADNRWNQNSAVAGSISLTTSRKNKFIITGQETWEIPISIGSRLYSRASLLMGFDSAIVDESPNPKTVVVTNVTPGIPSIVDASAIGFGEKRLFFDGTGGHIDIQHTGTDFDLGSGDLTFFLEFEPSTTGSERLLFVLCSNPAGFAALRVDLADNKVRIRSSSDGTTWGINRLSVATFTANQPTTLMLSRTGNSWTLYLNGTLADSWTFSGSLIPNQVGSLHRIASENVLSRYTGFIDEILLAKGFSYPGLGAATIVPRASKFPRLAFTPGSTTGTVPAIAALGSNTVTGLSSGATGELIRVFDTESFNGTVGPVTPGQSFPSVGYLKLRKKTGNFIAGETLSLPGGATVVAATPGRRSWINVVGREGTSINVPKAGQLDILGDWYELGVTDGKVNQHFQFPVPDTCPGLSIETGPGTGVFEWWFNGGARWGTATQFIPTDTRGKYFYTRPSTGLIQLAKRSGSVVCGYLPPAGCKVRIGNVILSNGVSTDSYTSLNQSSVITNRYNISTGNNGNVKVDKVTSNWRMGFSSPFTIDIRNTSLAALTIDNPTNRPYVENICSGLFEDRDFVPLNVTTCLMGADIIDCYCSRYSGNVANNRAASFSDIINTLNIIGGVYHIFGTLTGLTRIDSSIYPLLLTRCYGFNITSVKSAGGRSLVSVCTDGNVRGFQYADNVIGETTNLFAVPAIDVSQSHRINMDGYTNYDNLPNVHPYSSLYNYSSGSTYGLVENIGTQENPYDMGTNAHKSGHIVSGSVMDILVVRRCYVKNNRLSVVSNNLTLSNLTLVDVWGDVTVTASFSSKNAVLKNGRWARTSGGQAASYGKHFESYYQSASTDSVKIKSLSISFNEPTTQTLPMIRVYGYGQDISYPRLSRFMKSSGIVLSEDRMSVVSGIGYVIADTSITIGDGKYWDWEATVGAIEDTAVIGVGRSTSISTGQDAGCVGYMSTGQINLGGSIIPYGSPYTTGDTIQVAIDSVAGTIVFFKNGVSQGTAATGMTGTYFPMLGSSLFACAYTVNFGQTPRSYAVQPGFTKDYGNPPPFFTGGGALIMPNLSDEIVLEMDYFIIGITGIAPLDLIYTVNNRSNLIVEFQYDLGSGYNGSWLVTSQATFDALAPMAIDPNTGIKIMVRVGVVTANLDNSATYLLFRFSTNDAISGMVYPIPPVLINGRLSGYEVGSRIRIYNATTSTELYNGVPTSASFSYSYVEGSGISTDDLIDIFVTSYSGTTAKLPYKTVVQASASGWDSLIVQKDDEVFAQIGIDGSVVTEFSMDVVNNYIKINKPDKQTTAQRLYAWTAYYRNTQQGIVNLFDSLEAIDILNYRRNPTTYTWYLYNELLTSLRISGAYIYSLDNSVFIADSEAGVSGSIFMDANRAYGVSVPTSGLTPQESALLSEVNNLAKETSVQTAIRAAKAAQAFSLL